MNKIATDLGYSAKEIEKPLVFCFSYYDFEVKLK